MKMNLHFKLSNISKLGAAILGAAALVVATAGLVVPNAALAQNFKVKVAHVDTVEHPKHLAFLKFKDLVEERSNGQLNVTVFHGGQLGDERENIEGAQLGTVHLACVSNGVMVPFSEKFMLLDIPFLFEDYEHARNVIDSEGQNLLFEDLEEIGLVGLAIWEQGYRNISTGKKAIRSFDDIGGLKIRTMEAPLHVTAFRGMGSNPTPMSFSQLYTSLMQGVVDGQENPLYVLTQEKFYEVQDYVVLTRHIYDPMPVIASKKWLDSLPPELQQIVINAMAEVTAYEREIAETLVNEAAEELPRLGVEVVSLSPEERSRFRDAAQPPVLEQVRAALGAEVVDNWLKAVNR
jgi:tripartite ATP-independent transporter DctP family solute receptor